ncbi:MAG: GspE/PulE family protein [Acidobacteriota bacterium]
MYENSKVQERREREEQATEQRARIVGLRYFDTRGVDETAELIPNVLEPKEMRASHIIPLQVGGDSTSYIFGVTSVTPQSEMNDLSQIYRDNGKIIVYYLISESGYRTLIDRYDPPRKTLYDDIIIATEGDSETIESVSKTLDTVGSEDILDYLIEQADQLGASDIHIENQRDNVRIRLRLDGTLHPVAYVSHDKYHVIMASIGSRADVSTAAVDAQTGHMQHPSVSKPGEVLNMRIETVPTVYGMDVVVRLFTFDQDLLNLDNLGLDAERKKHVEEVISHPHGMVMMVGPTGSGKSTTLYSIINALNDTTRKIITLEDPVEIALKGISQIPIDTNRGKTFGENLRAVMRLDPDVIMVGEIRDVDTAKTAIQASITGHLVLTTFHASSSAAAFARMIDMIGQNPIFSSAVRMVTSQRLVRKLDDSTKIEFEPDETTKKWIIDNLGELPPQIEKPDLVNIRLWKPGFSDEVPLGYKGRIMIMEQMLITEKIGEFIRGDAVDVSVQAIEKAAKSEGMVTMMQDGILRCLRGETTLEEINRVI